MGQQLITLGRTWAWAGERLSLLLQSAQAPQGVWHHPVAFGVLGAFAGAAPRDVLAAYFHQAALGMIGAGVRAIPVGHTHGQQILAYLHDQIESLTQDIITRPLESAGAGCPYYEVLCDEQTQLYARMFRS
jgi:urease accessory protein